MLEMLVELVFFKPAGDGDGGEIMWDPLATINLTI